MAKESKHVINFRNNHLKANEKIVAWADGYIGKTMGKGKDTQHNGSLLITNTQVAFHRKGFLGEVIETTPLKKITSVERKSTLGFRTISIHTSNDDLTFKTLVDKDKEQALIDAIEAGRETTNPIAPTASAVNDDPLEILKKLGELKVAGVLTEDEFQSKKSELLAKI
ncbi:MAG: PH domain-containing protein [Colwellia sp.]|nr:PH domain-containing protein [Colwellia sp.]